MRGSAHLVQLMFGVASALFGGVGVRKSCFVSTSNTVPILAVEATVVIVASRGCGGGSAATSEKSHDNDLGG